MPADDNKDRKIASLHITSTFKTQVFENHPEGIVCYRNENGEMICEGYDEGPRLHTTTTPVSKFHPRDAEIIDLLQKNWILLGDGSCSPYKSKEGSLLLQQEEY
ncbi:hypothetical protein MLD38_005175 [Melastoma candidum]|uniref:Uncharacterized protein n=1 Tax=Melastoma candidum TaxID=119954 RepID=A0ACB9S8U6_9MYRT|nr:hypothetical protein MLD38_005175 [Melastoma candidum]